MTWPNKIMLQDALRSANETIASIGARARSVDANFAGNVKSSFIERIQDGVLASKATLQGLAGAGLTTVGQYAKDQFEDQTLNIVTEFNAVVAAIDAVIAEVDALPGVTPGSVYTPAQTASLRSAIASLADATGQ